MLMAFLNKADAFCDIRNI